MRADNWPTYLDNLRKLPSVRKVTATEGEPSGDQRSDGTVEIWTPVGHHRLLVEEKRGTLNAAMEERVLSLLNRRRSGEWILFAPYVTALLAERLAKSHVNFMDEAGNCHLELPPGVLIHIVGRSPPPRPSVSSLTLNGYRVLLGLLVMPKLTNATVRELAAKVGVGKSTAADALRSLVEMGVLHKTRKEKILEGRHLLDRWVAGYADQLRPSLVLARYHPAEKDLEALEARAEDALRRRGVRWAFTGGVAAQRLTSHYRGEATAIHIERPVPELARELRLAPSHQGSLTVLRSPGPVLFDAMPMPGTASPVLVYAELLATGGERAREAAERIRSQYLTDIS